MYNTYRLSFCSVQVSLSITNVVICINVSVYLSPPSLPSYSIAFHVFFKRENFSLSIGINNVELCLRVQVTSVVSVYAGLLECVYRVWRCNVLVTVVVCMCSYVTLCFLVAPVATCLLLRVCSLSFSC
jgi:hypothetical protein